MDATLLRIAVTATALLCSRADARFAAADVVTAASRAPAAAPRDPWFSEDKFRHLAMSFAVTSFSFATVRSAGASDAALPAALATAIAAGIGKELHDARQGNGKFFSVRDLVWDALGVLAGYALVRNID